MRNKFIYKLFTVFILIVVPMNVGKSNESFIFDIKEIEILENGNKFLGKNGGTAKSKNGIIINAENFEYNKIENKLYAFNNVKITDQIKNIIIFTDKITYLKNEEIIFTENNSKALYKNILLTANNFKYNKFSNILDAQGTVKIEDNENNYYISSEIVTYYLKENRITTTGETNANIESKYTFYSSDLTILRNENKLSSSNFTRLVDTNTTQYEFDEFIYFFENEFLKAKNILVKYDKNVPDGQTDNASFLDGFFDLKNKTFKASNTKVNIKKNSFDNSENDPRIIGVSSESENGITSINKAIFTSCKIREDKCPPWSIRAKKITHDKKKKQLIYDQAFLQIYDKPVMYFPKFFHPDPSVDRQSGFLRPQLNNSDILGTSIYLPYFHIINDSKDITLKPTIFDKDIQMYQGEYRQKNLNSSFIADVNFVNGYKSKSLNKKKSLTHIFSKYDLDLKFKNYIKSFVSIFFEKSNNDTYLKVFDSNLFDVDKSIKPKNTSTLHSGIKVELDHKNFNFLGGMDIYENLTIGNSSDKYQYVLPYYDFSKNLVTNEIGSLEFNSVGSNKLSNTNNLRSRVINNLNFNSHSFYTDLGLKNNINIYFKNLNTIAKNDNKYKSSPSMQIANIYEFNSSLPLKKINKHVSEYLEPKISLRINPSDMQNNSSNKRLINTDNIFDINRIGSNDTFESGKSVTLGIDYKKETNTNIITTDVINNFFEVKLATAFRDKKENYIPVSSTLNQKNSNLFGSIKNHYYPISDKYAINSLGFDYYFSLNNLSDLEYNSLTGEISFYDFTTSIKFIEENGPIGDSNILENSFTYKIDELNFISFNTRRNKKINLTEYYDLLYEYKNDCLTAGLKYKKTYYQDRDLKPTEDLMLSFTFYPLTTYEQQIDENLYRN